MSDMPEARELGIFIAMAFRNLGSDSTVLEGIGDLTAPSKLVACTMRILDRFMTIA